MKSYTKGRYFFQRRIWGIKINQHDHEKHKMEGKHVHAGMIEDLKRRFIVSLIITIPVLLLLPLIQEIFGLEFIRFPGDLYLVFIL